MINTILPVTSRQFITYLFYDRKYDLSRLAVVTSQIKIFNSFFQKYIFNRYNFNLFVENLSEKGYKKSTINNYIALAKNYARFIKNKDFDDYKYFKNEDIIVDPLASGEIKALAEANLAYPKQYTRMKKVYKTLIYFIALTGCRIEEALSLKKKDVITSPYSVIFRNTKNGEQRGVPIVKWLYDLISEISSDNLVFVSFTGKKLSPVTINNELKKRAKYCGIKKIVHCHLFRHSFITEMIRQKVPLIYVARIVGHKDIQTTNRYTHSELSDLQEALMSHPLLREQMILIDITKKVKEYIARIVDNNQYNIRISESKDHFRLDIKNINA